MALTTIVHIAHKQRRQMLASLAWLVSIYALTPSQAVVPGAIVWRLKRVAAGFSGRNSLKRLHVYLFQFRYLLSISAYR